MINKMLGTEKRRMTMKKF